MRAHAAVLAGIAALAFPAVAAAEVTDPGAENPEGLGVNWGSSPSGWATDAYGQPMTPAVLDPASTGGRLFVSSANGATLFQNVPVTAEQLASGDRLELAADLGALGGDDARAELSFVGKDAAGNAVSSSSVSRGPTTFDRSSYGQVQRCSTTLQNPSNEIRTVSVSITSRVPSVADQVWADNVSLTPLRGARPVSAVPYPGLQAGCTPLLAYERQAVQIRQAQIAAQPVPVPQPAPAAQPAPVAAKLTLKGATKQRLGTLRFTVGSNKTGIVTIVARIGGVKLTRSLSFSTAGSRTFKLRTSAAQNRRLGAALAKGVVGIKVTASANGTTVSASSSLRK